MPSLTDVALLILFVVCCAWLWRSQAIRERALLLASRHCKKLGIELLDENVAWRSLRMCRDHRGRLRLAREYSFEFTVTGAQRLGGRILMFGQQLGRIELDAHFLAETPAEHTPPSSARVINLDDWRQQRSKPGQKPH